MTTRTDPLVESPAVSLAPLIRGGVGRAVSQAAALGVNVAV